MTPIRVLITDDAVVVRRLLSNLIDEDPELELVGVAQNGHVALAKIEQLKPDIVTLDIEMPEMDGLAALREIRARDRNLPVIMFSTLTARGASATMDALSLGASDYVCKPANVGSVAAAMESVRSELIPRIKSLCRPATKLTFPPMKRPVVRGAASGKVAVVAIGASTGGPNALARVLGSLPADLSVPVVITQHMPPVFTGFLAERLNGSATIAVREAADGDLLEPGTAYLAPGDHHLVFRRKARGLVAEVNQAPQENWCRPSVDVMFRSLAETVGGDVLAVMLTGMGHDGRDGTALLKEKGAHVIAQDQATSVVWGMPGAVTSAGLADEVLALGAIGPSIARHVEAARPLSSFARPAVTR